MSGVLVAVDAVADGVMGVAVNVLEGVKVFDGVTVGVKLGGTNWVGVACRVGVSGPAVGDGPGVGLSVGVSSVAVSVTICVGVLGKVGVILCCGGGAKVRAAKPRQ